MIRPLRVRHRVMTITLSVIVPMFFVLSLMNRSSVPTTNVQLPVLDGSQGEVFSQSVADASFAGLRGVSYRILREEGDGNQRAVVLVSEEVTRAPAWLLYWGKTVPASVGDISSDSYLLGEWEPAGTGISEEYLLPDEAHEGGFLFLVSLSHGDVVESVALE